ncbi:hypothetical protein MRU69_03465 [Kocuria flava]|uniref:hypothetical protein n=1 Tax=Kocuria flava TaxID=446860 RepID=UPI001FF6EDD8|nr:hypothetical protein [Kocuria flava]MCJ8503924.1 hypothetical protein [Kocuria flava]
MGELLYEWMTQQQAAAALEEYRAECGPALRRLRSWLEAQGVAPDDLLDGTPESTAPLWDRITARITALGTDPRTLDADPTRSRWPSWARHGKLVDPHPPEESLVLVDGFCAYLAEVLTAAVPQARWQVGEHRLVDHPSLNYPVLAAGGHQVFLPGLPLYSAYQSAHGRDPMDGDAMLAHVRRTAAALRGGTVAGGSSGEPLVTVVAEVGCFDVGLRADLPERHPALVERLVDELCERDGVVSVHRYGPAALVVDVPEWDEVRLKLWLTLWLERNLPH